jgi:hypothetical protein
MRLCFKLEKYASITFNMEKICKIYWLLIRKTILKEEYFWDNIILYGKRVLIYFVSLT